MMSKLGSGATVTSEPPSSEIWVLQASRGLPLMNIPQEPQTPIRQDDLHASVGDSFSLMIFSPSRTVVPGRHANR